MDPTSALASLALPDVLLCTCPAQLVLSQLPTIHSLRGLNLLCTVCTIGFSITCVAMSIKNGALTAAVIICHCGFALDEYA